MTFKRNDKSIINFISVFVIGIIFITVILLIAPQFIVRNNHRHSFTSTSDIKTTLVDRPEIAIVFGGGARGNKPSPVLENRLVAAIDLYNENLVSKIIVSGDYDPPFYDEPGTMLNYLTENGIPKTDIVVDQSGFSTYETCERASKVFNIKSAFAVTQTGHLDRAIYLCRSFGIETYGYSAERAGVKARSGQILRETASNVKAVFNVHFIGEDTIITEPKSVI